MSAGGNAFAIRVAAPADFAHLREIEAESDELFASVGIGPFQEDDAAHHLMAVDVVSVVGEPPLRFASVEVVDGAAHLWQLSVVPSIQRRGLGRALVAAVCDWARLMGYEAVTLTTFRDVPWNGPFYEKLGSYEPNRLRVGLEDIRQHERDIGDDDFGSRVWPGVEVAL